MKIIERINTGISMVVLVASAVVFLLFGWSGTGWKALTVPTSSMHPAIPAGSLVFVHRVPVSSLKIGDVITHTDPLNPEITLSHRIVKEYYVDNGKVQMFVTKGDANTFTDSPIAANLIKGQVVGHVPYVGQWLLDTKKPFIILPFLYLCALLIIVEETKRLNDYYRRIKLYRLEGYARHQALTKSHGKIPAVFGAGFTSVILLSTLCGPVAMAQFEFVSSPVAITGNSINYINPQTCDQSSQDASC